MFQGPKRSTRIAIASLIVVTSCAVSWASYTEITRRISNQILLANLLHRESRTYHATFNNTCFGTLSSHFEETDKGRIFNAKGEFMVRQGAAIIRIALTLKLAFNELDQLGGAILRFWNKQTPQRQVVLGTSGTNPVKAELTVTQKPFPFHLEFSVPGPYTLVPTSGETFGILQPPIDLALPVPTLDEQRFRLDGPFPTTTSPTCQFDPSQAPNLQGLAQENMKDALQSLSQIRNALGKE